MQYWDTIEHYIFSCKSVKPFWSEIERWWNEKSTCPVILTEKHVIICLYYDLTHFSAKMNDNTIYFNKTLFIK